MMTMMRWRHSPTRRAWRARRAGLASRGKFCGDRGIVVDSRRRR